MVKVTYKIETFKTGEKMVSFFDTKLSLAPFHQETLSANVTDKQAKNFADGRVNDYEWAMK